MRAKRKLAIVLVCVLPVVAAIVALRPQWIKWRTRSALEVAASNLSACMLGRHGDVAANLLAARAGAIAKAEPAGQAWPVRCKPWGDAAMVAYEAVSGSTDQEADAWSSRAFLESLQPFWVRDPDPRVPLPDVRAFAFTEDKLVPIVDGNELAVRITDGMIEIGTTLRIDRDDHVVHVEPSSPKLPGHPTWRAIDAEPGAKRHWTDGVTLYDDAGHALHDEPFSDLVYARAFADGRVVAHVYVIEASESHGEIWELSRDKKLARTRFERNVPSNSKSTTTIDEWMLYKHVDGADATVAAIDFSRGVAAKPITLGRVEKTSRALGRSYGTCRARTTFVDMDPSLLIRTKEGWRFAGLDQSIERIVSCEGDVAMVTEWVPLEIRKCTQEGCALVPFPRLDAGREGAFAADEHHVFQLVRADGSVGVHVYDLANPSDAHHVPLLDHAGDVQLRVVAGRAIVFVKKGGAWAALSVRPDGTARAIQ